VSRALIPICETLWNTSRMYYSVASTFMTACISKAVQKHTWKHSYAYVVAITPVLDCWCSGSVYPAFVKNIITTTPDNYKRSSMVTWPLWRSLWLVNLTETLSNRPELTYIMRQRERDREGERRVRGSVMWVERVDGSSILAAMRYVYWLITRTVV